MGTTGSELRVIFCLAISAQLTLVWLPLGLLHYVWGVI